MRSLIVRMVQVAKALIPRFVFQSEMVKYYRACAEEENKNCGISALETTYRQLKNEVSNPQFKRAPVKRYVVS